MLEQRGLAAEIEQLQVLESLLEMPGAVARRVRVPQPDRLPPGSLALDVVDPELIQRGIYIFMDWRTAWRTRKGDGLAPRWLYHWALLDKRFEALNKNYARKLYPHTNKYTGRRPVDEPAIAVFEIVNEKDIFSVFTGKYKKSPDAARLKAELKKRFNQWLLKKYGDREKLAEAWTDDGVYAHRFAALEQFAQENRIGCLWQ